jgi:hypothetical protein
MNRTWALARAGGGAGTSPRNSPQHTTLTARDSPFQRVTDTTFRLDHIHRLRAREYNPLTDAHFLLWINLAVFTFFPSRSQLLNLVTTLTLPTPCGRLLTIPLLPEP